MNSLDRETIRRCAHHCCRRERLPAVGGRLRAELPATTIEDGIERMTKRHEIELALRSVLDD